MKKVLDRLARRVKSIGADHPFRAPLLMVGASLVASAFLTLAFPLGAGIGDKVTTFVMFQMFTYFPPAMTMVVLGMRGEALERRQKQAEFEARDKDAWARELVGKEIEVDGVGHLQAVLDLRPLQTRCKELESSLPNNYVQYLDEAWSPEEVQAVQRAIDNVTLPVHDVDL